MIRKVLFVDDEFLVCNYLRSLIPWEKQGFTICGEAYNGREALEMIASLKPDLALIDVSMPVMDGIELMRAIKQTQTNVKIIILSSYSDYDYVRETLRLGAVDYLLKHRLDVRELLRVIKNAVEQMPEISTVNSDINGETRSFEGLSMRDSNIRNFLEGKTTGLSSALLHMKNIIVAIAEIHMPIGSVWGDSNIQDEPDRFIEPILGMSEQILSNFKCAKVVYMGNKRLVYLFPALAGEDEAMHESRVASCMGVIKDAVLKYHNIYMVWSSSRRCMLSDSLPQGYAEAVRRINDVSDRRDDAGIPSSMTLDQERRLISCVYTGNTSMLHDVLYEILSPFANGGLYRTALQLMISDILSLVVKLYRQRGIRLNSIQDANVNNGDVRQIADWLESLFVNLINAQNNSRVNWADIVQQAVAYLEKNYNSDITLMDIARHCCVNPAYLSHLFKKEVGMGLIQFLNRVRIFHAMKLMLLDDVQTSLVYQQVGFNNYNHFFNTFKSVTGTSPAVFKQKETSFKWMLNFNPLQNHE